MLVEIRVSTHKIKNKNVLFLEFRAMVYKSVLSGYTSFFLAGKFKAPIRPGAVGQKLCLVYSVSLEDDTMSLVDFILLAAKHALNLNSNILGNNTFVNNSPHRNRNLIKPHCK